MKVFSMFTGIGGFELGIHNAYRSQDRIGSSRETENQSTDGQGLFLETGQNPSTTNRLTRPSITNETDDGPLCVGYSEIDKYAIQTFEKNFGKEVKNHGDATTINTAELPDFDLLVGGFPCQAFSVAGKRAGFNDTRGTLIFDVVRILRDKRPRYFVLENVKGLLSHDSGKTFSHILEILTDSGYDVSWSIHNSKNYGVPQNRERIYLIGSLRGERRPQVFPVTGADQQDIIVSGVLDTETWRKRHEQIRRVHSTEGLSPTLPTGTGGGVMTKIEDKQPFITQQIRDRLAQARPNEKDIGITFHKNGDVRPHRLDKSKSGISELAINYEANVSNTVTSSHEPKVYTADNPRIRRLTPKECERLQGFPDNWTIGSDTQRYKQCGNAVTVNVVEHVVSELLAPTQS